MAKRRKDKEDEETEEQDFKLPKFDEEAFIKKEKEKIRATFLSFAFGFIVAIITFGFWQLLVDSPVQWTLIFLLGVFNAAWLRYLFARLGVSEEILERKGMFTSYAIYFLTWLFVLIVLINPPFYDGDAPSIQAVALPDMQELGGTVKVIAHVADNSGIKNDQVQFILTYNNTAIIQDTYTLQNNIFSYEYENEASNMGTYYYSISTEDTAGRTTEINGSFTYSDDVIKIPEPTEASTEKGANIGYATDIKIDVKADVNWVYYTVDDETVNVTKEKNQDFYITNAQYKGWEKNSKPSVNVYGKVIYYFENIPTPFENSIIDTTIYHFNVSDDSEIGTIDQPIPKIPTPRMVTVPGFELLFVVVALAAAVFIFKYKKKHNQP